MDSTISSPDGRTWACCAYLRKSREDEERERMGKGETLARHRKIIESMAMENGHIIKEWYPEVVSGETIAARHEIKRLLADLADGKWDAVYAVEASRLGRGGGSDQEKIINAFRYTDTALITEMKTYDPHSRGDMRQLKSELRSSEDELDAISTRLRRGKYQAAKEGVWQASGKPPFGWRSVRVNGMWTLEPSERHADLMRIYDLLEAGENYSAIARIFDDEGIPTPKGGDHWRHQTVKAIAENPVNCGMNRFGAHTIVREFDKETFEVRKARKKNPSPQLARGLWCGNGTISVDRFERLVKKSVASARLYGNRELKNPLAGLLRCAECGYVMPMHMMSSGKSQAYFYQHPRKDSRRLHSCKGCRGARADQVITMVADALRKTANDVRIELANPAVDASEAQREALESSLRKEQLARKRAGDAYEGGVYDLAEFKQRRQKIDKRIEALEAKLAKAKPKRYSEQTAVTLLECIDLLEDDAVPAKAKNDFLKQIIERIDYSNETPPYIRPNKPHLEIYLR